MIMVSQVAYLVFQPLPVFLLSGLKYVTPQEQGTFPPIFHRRCSECPYTGGCKRRNAKKGGRKKYSLVKAKKGRHRKQGSMAARRGKREELPCGPVAGGTPSKAAPRFMRSATVADVELACQKSKGFLLNGSAPLYHIMDLMNWE